MPTIDESELVGKIRDKPIGAKLRTVLLAAASAAGIDVVKVTSGSQPGTSGRSTGSTRHNGGRAADLELVKGGSSLTFTDQSGGAVVEAFVTAAAANGATGIGAGLGYMGNKTLHIGFGLNANDRSKLVWGKNGRSAAAPAWLRRAAQKGWDSPAVQAAAALAFEAAAANDESSSGTESRVVIARDGLQLRKGPGVGFGISKTLVAGTRVTVLGTDGVNRDWARVDLVGDGLVDGHVLACYLGAGAATLEYSEDVAEPDEVEGND